MESKYIIKSESELEAVIGMPMNVKEKIVPRLDELMKQFIRKSPLVLFQPLMQMDILMFHRRETHADL